MKIFYFKAECKFEAENLDDTFQKLIDHFTNLMNHKDSNLIRYGNMELIPQYSHQQL